MSVAETEPNSLPPSPAFTVMDNDSFSIRVAISSAIAFSSEARNSRDCRIFSASFSAPEVALNASP